MPDFPEDSPFVQGFNSLFDTFVSSVRNYGDCNEIADKIAKWDRETLRKVWVDCGTPMQCGFQVMNHGDIWLNNMMFRSDEDNNPLEVSLIDFQIAFWASPSPDLLYFLVSSVADDLKCEHFDEFIEYYHEQLVSALKELKYDEHIPNINELRKDLIAKSGYGSAFS